MLAISGTRWGSASVMARKCSTWTSLAGQVECQQNSSGPSSSFAAGSFGNNVTDMSSARNLSRCSEPYKPARQKRHFGAQELRKGAGALVLGGVKFFPFQCKPR